MTKFRFFLCRSVYLEFFKKIGWTKVASLTQEGQQYSGYVSELQDHLQTHGIDFVINRKFQESAINTPEADMSMVSLYSLVLILPVSKPCDIISLGYVRYVIAS